MLYFLNLEFIDNDNFEENKSERTCQQKNNPKTTKNIPTNIQP